MADAARSPPGGRLERRKARGQTSRNGRRPTNPQLFYKDLQVAETDSPEQAYRATGAQEASSTQSPGQVWQKQSGARTAASVLTDADVKDPVLWDVA